MMSPTDTLHLDCLMCGTPLAIPRQRLGQLCRCSECGEVMVATEFSMQPSSPDEATRRERLEPAHMILAYPPMMILLGMILIALLLWLAGDILWYWYE